MRVPWGWVAGLLMLGSGTARAQTTLEAFSGSSWNLPTTLSIYQAGQPDLHFTAHYSTRPGEDTPYFGGRIAFWHDNKAWVLEFIHHKLYLDNPPPEVQWFKITYGFNMITLGRAWRHGPLSYSVGLGAVVTHASNSVRGLRYSGTGGPLNKGYTFSGATSQAGVQYGFNLFGGIFLGVGGTVSASYVEVKVRHGEAHVPNLAGHLNAGLGYSF
ncbi:MAG: hypothetical protein ABI679_00980 [Gemmatimonadota bacterium]